MSNWGVWAWAVALVVAITIVTVLSVVADKWYARKVRDKGRRDHLARQHRENLENDEKRRPR